MKTKDGCPPLYARNRNSVVSATPFGEQSTMEKEEVSKEEKRRLKKEQKEKVKMEKCPMDRVLMGRYLRSKQRTKERCRESMFVLLDCLNCRKRKRREFAERRDRECAGMTEEQKKEWMQQQKDEGSVSASL